MIFSRDISCCQTGAACVAIGSFDGVHLGHQALIRAMVESAKALHVPSVVINFYPQPIVVLKQIERDFYITELEERKTLIGDLGVDYLITLPFTLALAQTSAFDFLRDLHQRFGMRELWVGEDFALGKGRSGDVTRLREIGAELGFQLFAIPHVRVGAEVVSSSLIRAALRAGDLVRAERFLGRPFIIKGTVIHGARRGHEIGYPTANVAMDAMRVALREGVYWTRFTVDGVEHTGATSVGTNPTFVHLPNPPISVETYILDFDEYIYDKMVQIEFRQFLRDQVVYSSVESLVEQIAKDVAEVRGYERNDSTRPANLLTRPAETHS